ncbi:hypothetical protein WME97_22800 [Sorangium sp. So ce367]|uniref:hypothetical protein n=1 Tax=Sorangium sp. So ce367 TaxID=3133305 RepID=UPI003F5E59A9
MKRIWQVLIALAAAGGVAALAVDRRRDEAELARMREDMGALSRAIEATKSGPALAGAAPRPERRIEAAAPAPAAPPAEAPAAPAPEPPGEENESAPTVERRAAALAAVRERLEDTFTQQGTDARWSAEAREAAREKLSAALPDTSSLRSIECRSSMCRVETVHQDFEQYEQFVRSTFMNPQEALWRGGFFTLPVNDPREGELVTVAYVGREGAPLPISL